MKKEATIGTVLKELRTVQKDIKSEVMKELLGMRTDMNHLNTELHEFRGEVKHELSRIESKIDQVDDRLEVVAITAMRTQEIVEQLIPRLPVAKRAYSH